MHFVSCLLKVDLHVLQLFTFCGSIKTHGFFLDRTTPKMPVYGDNSGLKS